MEAKRRRQKIYVIAGLVLLAALAAFEVPKTIKMLSGNSSSEAPVAVQTTPATAPIVGPLPKSLRSATPVDPFSQRSGGSGDPGPGPAAGGGRDPFAPTNSIAAVRVSSPLPEQIVIGTPGGNKHAEHGWIVILASIPTAQGRSAAESFAKRAGGLGGLSILNSSNRRPLRGGYWVVYAGPYQTLAEVSTRASQVHGAGYPTAYIRELIVYR